MLADWYFENSQPITAACCHLAVSDVKVGLAMCKTHLINTRYFIR